MVRYSESRIGAGSAGGSCASVVSILETDF